ncbi:hypothetical protein FCH28_29165 [Streptomyces piniterrae]|uniref:FAD-binding domain-containing protein n=1 Tax=Streptomyces piniterrae TaxID=2571125 RepID=A0A4U0MTW5_9ACTN|nr:FAD-dependent monooxygenase [Streptomyces piniterrae]TJZ44427.1 hypothetical protein FCH28_29165 [Streptomyces piniterrae]
MREEAQVVIAGGGPVGMLMAAELAGYGVDTVVLETKGTTDRHPKAGTLHARTVQSLVRRGYLDHPPLSSGTGTVATPFHFGGFPVLTITTPAAEPTPLLKRSQADLESEFETQARKRGARVLREYEVTEVDQTEGYAEAVAEGPDGVRRFRAEYLVGADGARSTVRERLGFSADIHPPTVSAMMGVVRPTEPGSVPQGWQRTPRGWIVGREQRDGHHLVRTLNYAGAHPDRHSPLTRQELQDELSWIAGRDIPLADAQSLSRFSDFTRLVHRYRQGRVFLAGDAAHVHFPIGGQGLSTGLLDVLNLAWKLAHALRGTAGAGLLDTYEDERRPAAQRVVDNTRAQLVLMRPESDLDPLRELVGELITLEQGSHLVGGLISAQDTVHPSRSGRASAWEGRFLDNVPLTTDDEGPTDVVGLLRDGRPTLLLLGAGHEATAAAADGWSHVVRTVRAEPQPSLPYDALLVRPDGYVAWTPDGDDLADSLRTWFGDPR